MPPRKINRVVKLNIPAGEASPAHVGKDIGPLGINMLEFCRQYNEATASQRGFVIPAVITVFEDRSFTLETRKPTTASLLTHAAGIPKGATAPNGVAVGSITRAQLREIASLKLVDMNAIDVDGAEKMIAGTARSMGIAIR
jgi:large subunit ribosomal protein L11